MPRDSTVALGYLSQSFGTVAAAVGPGSIVWERRGAISIGLANANAHPQQDQTTSDGMWRRLACKADVRPYLPGDGTQRGKLQNMSWTDEHMEWLVYEAELHTADGIPVRLWELHPEADEEVLSAWASHFRRYYCSDDEIDDLREGTGLSRKDYLCELVFPDENETPGPSTRAGDFNLMSLVHALYGRAANEA